MRIEERRTWPRIRRPVAVGLVVIFVLVAPTWLWFVRGRRLPVHVTLTADRYTATAGSSVTLRARIWPTPDRAHWFWEGPGVSGHGAQARWRLPSEPGVYTAKLTVRRAGAAASDAISIQVTTGSCTVDRPPPRELPPLNAPRCPTGTAKPVRLRVHGVPCWGANLVAEVTAPPGQATWLWWTQTRREAQPGPLANLRLPSPPSEQGSTLPEARREITAMVYDPRRRCAVVATAPVLAQSCRAGPLLRGVFADFRWELIGPSTFRLVAKPPRRVSDTKATRYRWSFGDGKQRESSSPATVHRYADDKPQHLVSLETVLGETHAATLAAVTNRAAHSGDEPTP